MKKIITKILNWVSNNKLIILLVLVALVVLGYPLYIFGVNNSFFYNLDPDVVYVTNALLYTKYAIISYMDHPGTPTIMLLYYLLFPLRIIAKYILHQGFIQWSFDNYAFLTFYLRTLYLAITGATLFIYLKLIEGIIKSKALVAVAFLLIFSSGILSWAISIAPEAPSLLLVAIWLIFFAKFLKTPKYSLSVIMVFISGIAVANKFTNAFLVIPAIFLPLFIQREKLGRKFIMVEANFTIFVQAFLIGIWPIRDRLLGIVDWVRKLYSHTEKYGVGAKKVFDWNSYYSSLNALAHSNPLVFIFIALAILLVIGLFVAKKLQKGDAAVSFVFFTGLAGFLIFSKYSAIHYNYVNIFLIVFCAVYFVSKLKNIWVKILLPVLAIAFIFTSYNYFVMSRERIQKSQSESVYSVLNGWSSFWSADIFRQQLDAAGFLKP